MSILVRIHWHLLSILFLGLVGASAQAEQRIKLAVEPSQAVLAAGQDNKAYLRVKLEGLPFEESVSRPPVNVSLVIDRSGSMTGAKIEQAKEAAILLFRDCPRKTACRSLLSITA